MNIALGTAAIGRPQYINIRNEEVLEPFDKIRFIQEGKVILTNAYENGVKHFDTAPGYGIAEQIVLDWIKENDVQDVTVSTKWGYRYVANFDPNAEVHEVKEHTLENLNRQWELSSALLPFLNFYQIHSATLESGVLENEMVLKRLHELKENHDLEIGLSVSGSNQNEIIQKALKVEVNGKSLFDVLQVTYNVFNQSLSAIKEQVVGKKIIVKEALANGRIFPNGNYANYDAAYTYLIQLAKKYNVGIDAIALRFCEDTIAPHCILSGASKSKQLLENLKAHEFTLTQSEIDQLKTMKVAPTHYWNERKQLAWN